MRISQIAMETWIVLSKLFRAANKLHLGKHRHFIYAMATVLGVMCAEPSLAATCKAFSLYASGVTPQTKTPLSGQNALAVSMHKNGGCGWGVSTKQPSLEAAEAQALAKCQMHAANTACTIVGLNGVITARVSRPSKDAKEDKANVKSLARLNTKNFVQNPTARDATRGPQTAEAAAKDPRTNAADEKRKAADSEAIVPTGKSAPISSLNAAPVTELHSQVDPRIQTLKNHVTVAIGAEAAARVFDGDPKDIVILLNETSSAPHADRMLSGEIRFRENTAEACRIKPDEFDEPLDFYIQNEIRKTFPDISFSKFLVASRPCVANTRSDLLIVRRGTIRNSEVLGFNVGDVLVRRQYSIFMVVPIAPFDLLKASVHRLQQTNSERLVGGTLDGFGSIAIPAGSQQVVCVSKAEDADFIRDMLSELRSAAIFEPRWPESPTIIEDTPDEIFIKAKRQGCGFIAGDAGLLQMMITGLRRDGVKLTTNSVFASKERATEIAQSVTRQRQLIASQREHDASEEAKSEAKQRRLAKQREIDELRRLEILKTQDADQRALEETKRKNDEKARLEEVDRQRKRVASRGQTIVDAFEVRLRKHILSVTRQLSELKRRAAVGDIPSEADLWKQQSQLDDERLTKVFPSWANWFSDRVKEEWKFGDPILTLQDYGMAKWKDRPIEAISVKVEFPMLNRVIGDRKKVCAVFVWINDEEFSFYREPQTFECDLYKGPYQAWSMRNQFESQWNVSLQ